MLRALRFIVRTGVLVAITVWIANQTGEVEIHWAPYDIKMEFRYALAALLAFILLCLLVYRVIIEIVKFPASWGRYREYGQKQKGFRALTLGLTAVAAGDAKLANYHAHRGRKFLQSDNGLTVLLEAQASRLKGDDAGARGHFEKLMKNPDTAFLGLRGLLQNALEQRDHNRALALAREAVSLHPDQPWILRIAYDLEVKQGHWQEAQKLLKQGIPHKAFDEGRAMKDRVALYLQEGEEFLKAGNESAALVRFKQARNTDPTFIPAALALARYYIGHDNTKAAADVIEKAWKHSPHPELADLWREALPKKLAKDNTGHIKWFERLVALRPDDLESQLAAAGAAIENGLWGSARAYLERADSIRPGARLYRLRARLAQALDRPEEASLMIRKAAEATPEKAWVCRETGRIYDRWSPVAQPHGAFNTIVWDYPLRDRDDAIADRSELLITAPAARG